MTHLNTSIVISQCGRKFISTGFATWFLLSAIMEYPDVKKRLKIVRRILLKNSDFIEWDGELKNDEGREYGNIYYFPKTFK